MPSPSIDMSTHKFEGGDCGCTSTKHLHEETHIYQWCVLLSMLGGVYVCVQIKIVIERTRDLIYFKFVATDFFPKIISPSTGEISGDLA